MNDLKPLRVLVVDDTILYRKIVGDALSELPGVEVVGTASNGQLALSKIDSLKPDLITLDIEMPKMNGIEVLTRMQKTMPEVGAIMLSTLTLKGGDLTIKGLELGAFDFITKPQTGTMAENMEAIRNSLGSILKAFRRHREIKNILKGKTGQKASPPAASRPVVSEAKNKSEGVIQRMSRISRRIKSKSDIVAIGISTGGPNALGKMMPKIPGNVGVPILIVQHMPPIFTNSLAKSLNSKCSISVKEARDGDLIEPGIALIAPGGKQMRVAASPDGLNRIIRITDDPPENSCKPSVDYLFRSVAAHYIGRAAAVIMTGMGYDGKKGLAHLKKSGAFVIAQDEESCTVFGMPREAIAAGMADLIVPLDQIAQEITNAVKTFH